MWCQIWRFYLRNTLKSAPKENKNVKESATLFFKTMLFFFTDFLRRFSHVYVHKSDLPLKQKLDH